MGTLSEAGAVADPRPLLRLTHWGMTERRPTTNGPQLRRLPRQPEQLDSLELYGRVLEMNNLPIGDAANVDRGLASIRNGLMKAVGRESTLQGWRAQALFEAMVAALGTVKLMKVEDTGDVYSQDDIKVPDFRIVSGNDRRILVDVENFYADDPQAQFRVRSNDAKALQQYASVVGGNELKLAIYWARWNLWTLTGLDRMRPQGKRLAISLPEAAKNNEMNILGDYMIGTEWPLTLTLFSDTSRSHKLDRDGTVDFTVGGAEYSVAGVMVPNPTEQRIIHTLMMYGNWTESTEVDVRDGELISISIHVVPIEPPIEQGFAIHGPLSTLFSRMYLDATTATDGSIRGLRLNIDPGTLASLIPEGYDGETLRLWTFHVSPR